MVAAPQTPEAVGGLDDLVPAAQGLLVAGLVAANGAEGDAFGLIGGRQDGVELQDDLDHGDSSLGGFSR